MRDENCFVCVSLGRRDPKAPPASLGWSPPAAPVCEGSEVQADVSSFKGDKSLTALARSLLHLNKDKWMIGTCQITAGVIHPAHSSHFPIMGNIQLHFVGSKSCWKKNDPLRMRPWTLDMLQLTEGGRGVWGVVTVPLLCPQGLKPDLWLAVRRCHRAEWPTCHQTKDLSLLWTHGPKHKLFFHVQWATESFGLDKTSKVESSINPALLSSH